VAAHSFPSHEKHFLGVEKYGRRQFVGQTKLLEDIDAHLKNQNQPTAVVGIGGIGYSNTLSSNLH
jgi:hypothetical protein